MADLQTLAARIEADRAEVESLAGPINSSKGQAEYAAAAIGGLGAEAASVRLRGVVDKIEEAESIRASLQGALVKAHFMVVSAMHGRMGPGAPGSGAVVPLKRVDAQTGAPKAGLDAVPPHLRQDPTPSGEELSGIDPTIGPFQKEHEGAGDDKKMSKLSRFGRTAVRNTGDLAEASKNIVDARADTFERDYDPWGPSAQTTTEVPSAPPSAPGFYRPEAADIRAGDVIGTSIVVAVIAVEGLSRILRKREHGK
ncbi:hypothetical protein [Glycomyces rhizosphaerae]|uniref:DUF3618 domain-containing protein n=1 Tax=Glycomyces rhizosphaerae TaxID=2054422 RepID=A0ABV7PY48_9ACTN